MSKDLINKLDDLKSTYNQLLSEAKGLTEEQLNFKPNENDWSIGQVLYHCWLAIDLAFQYVDKKLKEGNNTKQVGFENFVRFILLKIALISPFKFKAPRIVRDNLVQKTTYKELQDLSAASFERIKVLLENYPEELKNAEIFKHPVIGWVTISQTLEFLKDHTLHHKMQIENVMKNLK